MSRDPLLSLIDPDPEQPRKHFDEVSLQELAQSMAAHGLAMPILLDPRLTGVISSSMVSGGGERHASSAGRPSRPRCES